MRTHVVSRGSTHFCRHIAPSLSMQGHPSCPISNLRSQHLIPSLLFSHLLDPGGGQGSSLLFPRPEGSQGSGAKVLAHKDFQRGPRGRHWQANTCPLATGESFLKMEHNGERKVHLFLFHASFLSFRRFALSFLPLTFQL